MKRPRRWTFAASIDVVLWWAVFFEMGESRPAQGLIPTNANSWYVSQCARRDRRHMPVPAILLEEWRPLPTACAFDLEAMCRQTILQSGLELAPPILRNRDDGRM